ncbi:hypothetical protein BSKO_12812 [Bryopsis sp. KO-2023]|nr:hypothetical protein BSKO_12812 [Bryopsis sp. KO-2023]
MPELERLPVGQIVKVGGAAITEKQRFETLNSEVLRETAKHLKVVYDKNQREGLGLIVVHGAGSFGHFQASQSGVSKGGIDREDVRTGFVNTRLSVTKLNHHVVTAMVQEGIPAVGVSVCGHWTTAARQINSGPVDEIAGLLRAGLVPILHGDAVLDIALGCTILSGDVIVRHLAAHFRPNFVLFLTNVEGIYDQPPANEGAELIKEITVNSDGTWLAGTGATKISFEISDHDTTGGIETKIKEAVDIACMGLDVLIAKAGTQCGLEACENGPLVEKHWVGTHVKFNS